MILVAFAAGVVATFALLLGRALVRTWIGRTRRGPFPVGYVDRFILDATPERHVALTVIDAEGKATRHVLHALHAHQLSSHLLVASAKARDPRAGGNGEAPKEVA